MNHEDNRVQQKRGFTLIELMLAMTFISFLLVAIAMTIIQISTTYNRGMTLKEINQVGRSMTSEVQRTISTTTPFPIEPGPGTRLIDSSWGGRLCVGQYSYIWNYGKELLANDPSLNRYVGSDAGTQIRFVKVLDGEAAYCSDPTKAINRANAVELMNSGDHTLVLHTFAIKSALTAIDSSTRERLYSISFTIGTNDQAALVADQSACSEPGTPGSDLAYCAVQQFNVVARAGNAI